MSTIEDWRRTEPRREALRELFVALLEVADKSGFQVDLRTHEDDPFCHVTPGRIEVLLKQDSR